jgi:ecotin
MLRLLTLATLAIFSLAAMAAAADNMKAFPPAADGQVRYVLNLPKKDDESLLKVEIVVGKTVMVDSQNHYFFAGKIVETVIEGWGFPRYDVKTLGPMAGTLMAVDPNAPKVNKFITIGGDPFLLRYNSQLPIVVYVPKDAEVRYRIWSAEPQAKPVDKG